MMKAYALIIGDFLQKCVCPTNRIHLTSNVDIYESEDNIRIS